MCLKNLKKMYTAIQTIADIPIIKVHATAGFNFCNSDTITYSF
jgi:hypothetical protein